jgi:23S rRNA (adenine2503-C2)-methyltransferase
MGEPALNPNVLEALCELPQRFRAPGLIPCIATIAPASSSAWFDELCEIRRTVYRGSPFQLQLSINSTDESVRDRLMPVCKMTLSELGELTNRFYEAGTRKTGLNFALTENVPVEPQVVAKYFNPRNCCVKITPLNPTYRSAETGLSTALPPEAPGTAQRLSDEFGRLGFDVILSIGDVRENQIGSNCGMAVRRINSDRRS